MNRKNPKSRLVKQESRRKKYYFDREKKEKKKYESKYRTFLSQVQLLYNYVSAF